MIKAALTVAQLLNLKTSTVTFSDEADCFLFTRKTEVEAAEVPYKITGFSSGVNNGKSGDAGEAKYPNESKPSGSSFPDVIYGSNFFRLDLPAFVVCSENFKRLGFSRDSNVLLNKLRRNPLRNSISRILNDAEIKTVAVSDGVNYRGQWFNSLPHGLGMFITSTSCYLGEIREGMIHGFGKYTFKNGVKYYGSFKNGKEEGRGWVVWPEKHQFIGIFLNGLPDGLGILKQTDGFIYIGNYRKGAFEGKGWSILPFRYHYFGDFWNDKRHGHGLMTYWDGSTYEGEFYKDKMDGTGRFESSDGSAYEGEWLNNKKHGKGEFWEAAAADGSAGRHYKGEWRHGVLYRMEGSDDDDHHHHHHGGVGGVVIASRTTGCSSPAVKVNSPGFKLDLPASIVNSRAFRFIMGFAGSPRHFLNSFPTNPLEREIYSIPQNTGELSFPDGTRYKGAVAVKGRSEGESIQKYYEAHGVPALCWALRRGKTVYAEGIGRAELPTGDSYLGEFHKGRREGFGKYTTRDGSIYYGFFKDNVPDGIGWFIWYEGHQYIGYFVNGHRNGKGIQREASGLIYIGDFRKDRFEGRGWLLLIDGDSYMGRFIANYQHGKGVYKSKQEMSIYVGDFFKNKRDGKGWYKLHDWGSYSGGWIDDLTQGWGDFRQPVQQQTQGQKALRGCHFVGEFNEGWWHGRGCLKDSDGSVYRGEWRYGVFVFEF